MAKVKKAQMGKKVTDKANPKSEAGLPKRKNYDSVMNKYLESTKSKTPVSVPKKKMKSGGSFPDLNKDGKVTKKDVLIGRGVLPKTAKKGAALKKQAAVAIAMKKAGKSPKKAMGGMSMTKMANMKKGGKCKYGC